MLKTVTNRTEGISRKFVIWNSSGQKFDIDLHLRPPSSSSPSKSSTSPLATEQDIVPVKCTLSAFINPYSTKVNYVVGYVRRLQTAVSSNSESDVPTVPYHSTFASVDSGHQVVQQAVQEQNGVYWGGGHIQCPTLQLQRNYVSEYDFPSSSTGPADDSYSTKLNEGHSMNSYPPQSQPVAHQSYLPATSPYIQPQSTPVPPYTTNQSVYSPNTVPLEGVSRTSTIAYLPMAAEQRSNGDWNHLGGSSVPPTPYHQSSYLHYLDASNSIPSVSGNPNPPPPPTYNAL
ncbi:hypothetical protein ACTXT7_005381 [Hymenolepis weldensis]